MKLNPKYVLLISDALIPILGFFFWDWSLYFILLFYFLDLLAQEAIMHLKTSQIVKHQGLSSLQQRIGFSVSSLLLVTAIIFMAHLTIGLMHPDINYWEELKAFWTYEELGIQQGYILLPLVAFAAYQQYKMSFLLPKNYERVKIVSLWKKHISALMVAMGFTGVAMGLSYFIALPEIVYVLAIVGIIALHNLVFKD